MSGFYSDIVSDQVAPPFLQQGAFGRGPGVSGRYMQMLGMGLDTIATRAQQAALVSLPGQGDPSALPFLANDRLLVQGASETNASFILRLSGAFDAWRVAGTPWAVLQQTSALFNGFSGGTPPMRTVSDSSVWDYYAAAANTKTPPTHLLPISSNWNWDGHSEWTGMVPGATPWWRYWLIVDSFGGSQWTSTEGNWGDAGNWGDGTASWGLSQPPAIFSSIRTVIRTWQSATSWCRWVVVNLNSGSYSPDAANSEPDGHWGFWGKLVSGVRVQSRDTTARYVDGVLTGS